MKLLLLEMCFFGFSYAQGACVADIESCSGPGCVSSQQYCNSRQTHNKHLQVKQICNDIAPKPVPGTVVTPYCGHGSCEGCVGSKCNSCQITCCFES
ncbi:hypothetical protein PTMSG1_04943 [Pyrenophora teres f. maculata]|nr:hypothetical protein PTMSG1_04943 [Pyrenophora teres f. maculata]